MNNRRKDSDGLCCCEYRNQDGDISHILGLCCDCEDFDRLCENLVIGRGVDTSRLEAVLNTAEDRLRIPWRGGAVHPPLEKVLPMILVPTYIWLCSLHPYCLVILTAILPLILYTTARCIIRLRPRSKVFLWFSYSTTAYIMYVYEVKLVGLFWDLPKIVSPIENLVLVLGAAGGIYFFLRVRIKSRSRKPSDNHTQDVRECRMCEREVYEKDHHCVWLDACISVINKKEFLLFLLFVSFSAFHLFLMLSSAACPGELLGPVLLPRPCWPDTPLSRLLLATGIYSGLISALLAIILIEQLTRRLRR